jgi:hypothetical protein
MFDVQQIFSFSLHHLALHAEDSTKQAAFSALTSLDPLLSGLRFEQHRAACRLCQAANKSQQALQESSF